MIGGGDFVENWQNVQNYREPHSDQRQQPCRVDHQLGCHILKIRKLKNVYFKFSIENN